MSITPTLIGAIAGSRRRSAGSSWSPQTQGTLVSWYDASVLGLSNGANITTFTDSKTGNPHPLTSSASVATFATGQQNGLSTAAFSGSQYYTTGCAVPTFPCTVAGVVKVPNYSNYYVLLSGSFGDLEIYFNVSDGKITLGGNSYIGQSSAGIGSAAYHTFTVVLTSSTWAIYIDGAASGSGSHSASLSGVAEQLGARAGGSIPFQSHVGEIQFYSSALGSTDLTAMQSYFVSKWSTP